MAMNASDSQQVIVAFGANLGDREQVLADAMLAISALASGPLRSSSWWSSQPVGMADDAGEFINGAVAFATRLSPLALLTALQAIEQRFGRPVQHGVNESRVLDLDIITYGDAVISLPHLTVPHPRARERRFVLLPLAELQPTLILPGQAETVAMLIERAPDSAVTRLRAAPALPPQPLP